ncbi:hypothetical protein BDZ94DRAFT_1214030, partial [Collybia nuda]
MNDPGLDEPIHNRFGEVTDALRSQVSHESQQSLGPRAAFRHELEVDEDEEEVGFFQPKRWWFTSTAFPLIAGTFGPLANLFSVCALVQTWRVSIPPGMTEAQGLRIKDPPWLLALNSVSLALALLANVLLLLNFAHRIRYSIAQPLTITLWYLAAMFLVVPLGLTKDLEIRPRATHAFSQSYYYALISAAVYIIISTLLVFNTVGAYAFKAYPPSFNSLTIPQRTLMLQTISYVFYLALGAGVFSAIEGWDFVDGLYFSDYTLLTIGLGSDFPLQHTLARALMIPYAACGITMIGLVIGSIRGLVLERGKTQVIRRTLGKQREKHIKNLSGPDEAWKKQEFETMRHIEQRAERIRKYTPLGTSFFAFVVVWLGGALVFWFSENKLQSWTYFESLYFAYTTLLTIGYGDFFPKSNSGKPFFVIWSLIAIPTVTILISDMGDTVIGWLKEGVLWLGERTILPEHKRKRQATERQAGMEQKQKQEDREGRGGEDLRGVRGDVEMLGEVVEREEESRGKGGSLAARIAKEISKVAMNIGHKPPKKYGWHEWTVWLDLLDMGNTSKPEDARDRSSQATIGWTWLGDDGPLLSSVTETEWVLRKLCQRLEEVMENEYEANVRENPS